MCDVEKEFSMAKFGVNHFFDKILEILNETFEKHFDGEHSNITIKTASLFF